MTALSRRDVLGAAATAAVAGVLPACAEDLAGIPQDPTAGRSLVFGDEFSTFDQALWNAGPKATNADSGFYGRSAFSGAAGAEGFNPYAVVDDPLAADGKALQISARYIGRRMSVYAYHGNDLPEFQWISGNIQTGRRDGTVSRGWRRGYFEARMRFPAHPLSFPAFWLMNRHSLLFPQTSIEIDVVEHKGWERNLYGLYLHEWGQPGEHHEGIGVPTGPDLTTGYFSYGVLIENARCVYYFERKPVLDRRTNRPFAWTIGRAPELAVNDDVFWPLLTLALRADVPFPAPLRDEDREAHLRIDHFRVYA